MRAALLLALALGGCSDQADREYLAAADGGAATPSGSVPRGASEHMLAVAPPGPPVTRALLALGLEAYRGKCAPCHGLRGAGDGPVVDKGFPPPPPLSRTPLPAARTVAIITSGRGEMPAMAGPVPPVERWAIAYWLERSQAGGR